MNTSPPQLTEQDVLFAFSEEENHDSATLDIYLKQYPEYREVLVALSVELLVSPVDEAAQEADVVSKESIESAWSKFQSLLSPSDPISTRSSNVENPLVKLDQKSFISLAKSLGVSRAFLARLRDGTIVMATIPTKFIDSVSGALEVGSDTLRSALQAPPTISTQARFKSDRKPTAEAQMTFDEAIESSGLSEVQKEQMKAMKD
jgi:hypothetical protein